MGQKVNPTGLRVGIIKDWESKWYAGKDYADLLHEDIKIREYLENRLKTAAVSHVEIERAANRVNVTIHTGKPGMVIGKGGSEVEALRNSLNSLTGKRVHINIVEIKKVDVNAKLVAENIARQLENRISFRRAQKQAIQRAMRAGAKGIKTQVSGRLGGADIAFVLNITVKELFHYTHYVLISTMQQQKLILRTVNLVLKCGSIVVKSFQLNRTNKEGAINMLMPKRVKYRRQHRGKMRGQAKGGTQVTFGEYGIQGS